MTQNRIKEEEVQKVESADRRHFLRNAMRLGGAAFLLTAASRKMLAGSLTLNSQEMDAARRAQLAKGSPLNAERMEVSAQPSGGYTGCDCSGCSGCTGTCSDGCGGGCRSCTGGCQGSCSGGCSDSCKGSSK